MVLPNEEIIEGNIAAGIAEYIENRKPVAVFFMGITQDGDSIGKNVDIIVSENIRFDWLATQLDKLAEMYREESKRKLPTT